MLDEVMDLVFGFRRPRFRFNTDPAPIFDLPSPSLLSISLCDWGGVVCAPAVKSGEEVSPGQFLGRSGDRPAVVSPVKGKVIGVSSGPDLRGGPAYSQILIAPAPESSGEVFEKLDPGKATLEELWGRMAEAGILTDSLRPRRLAEVIGPEAGEGLKTLVILAADREPLQCSALQVFRDRGDDSCRAALLLGKMSRAEKILIAVPQAAAGEARRASERQGGVSVLELSDYYPDSLEPLIALRLGNSEVRVVAVETALAAWEAVVAGRVQEKKAVTVIGPGPVVKGNYRVPLGTRLKDLLAAADLIPGEGDKVIAGGPMRGVAQYSLEGAIDCGVDAVTLIRAADIVPWSDEPCVNCGACVEVCPVRLQVGLLGRFAEFNLFDRAEELSVMNCIECGLCAAVCTARRPLVQWLRLAKDEVAKKRAAELARSAQGSGEAAAGG